MLDINPQILHILLDLLFVFPDISLPGGSYIYSQDSN